MVSSDLRAETLAEHLETSQWKVRPVGLVLEPWQPLRDPLRIELGPFTDDEFAKAIGKMKCGKATKTNDIPPEYFRALALEKGSMWSWMLDFCNECWNSRRVPQQWSLSEVAFLFEKGNPENPENYRPICLETVA